MTSLLIKRPQLAGLNGACPEDFGNTLLDEILALTMDRADAPPRAFVECLARADSETHRAIEQALMTALRIGLGHQAKPVLLNAWSEAFWSLLARYGISGSN